MLVTVGGGPSCPRPHGELGGGTIPWSSVSPGAQRPLELSVPSGLSTASRTGCDGTRGSRAGEGSSLCQR